MILRKCDTIKEMSRMSAIFNFDFQYKSLVHYILIQIPRQSDIWFRTY